jgi:hypothetical protein
VTADCTAVWAWWSPQRGSAPSPRAPVKGLWVAGYGLGLWVAGYGLAAVLPLASVLAGSPPAGRGFVIELASALGLVALSLLALQLALPARVPALARALGADVAVRFGGLGPASSRG